MPSAAAGKRRAMLEEVCMPTVRQQKPGAAVEMNARAIARCGVCKVDLKGRFVFVDEQAQQLFGCPGEELFGKALIDFVDEASRAVVNEILSRRNHYEITFDHIGLTLVVPGAAAIRAGAIVTLNFNAGNPVNFQFIFLADNAVAVDLVRDPHAAAYRRLVAYLDGRDLTADWRGYLGELQSFSGAVQVCAYLVSPDRLEPRSSALDAGDGVTSLPSIDPTGPLHRQVADTGETYDFTDQRSIQRAVELGAPAPNEVIARLALDEGQAALIRVIFPSDIADNDARVQADRTRFALELTQRLLAPPPPSADDRTADNIQFAIGLLDGLGIGAMMADSRGKTAVYNPVLARLFQVEDVSVDLVELAEILSGGAAEERQRLDDFLRGAARPSTGALELARVELPAGRPGLLAVLPLAENPNDRTAFVAIVPGALAADAADVLAFGRTLLSRLGADTAEAVALSARLGQRSAALDAEGKDQLHRLTESLQDLGRLTQDLRSALDISSRVQAPELTDLNIVLHRVVNHVNRGRGGQPLRVHTDLMLKVSTSRRAVTLALENLLQAVATGADRATATVRIAAELSGPSACRLTITVDSPLDRSHNDFAFGFSAARLLIRSIGGTLREEPRTAGVGFVIAFPVQP